MIHEILQTLTACVCSDGEGKGHELMLGHQFMSLSGKVLNLSSWMRMWADHINAQVETDWDMITCCTNSS